MPRAIGQPAAAVALLCCLLGAAAAAVGSAWADLAAANEERDAQGDLLGRSVDAGRRATLAGSRSKTADPFITAESDTQAAARLDEIVRAIVTDAGCALLSSQAEAKAPDPSRPDEGGLGTKVEDRATIEGENDRLQEVLVRLETGNPVVRVSALEIVPADGAGGGAAEPRLRLTVTLDAYRRGAGS